MFERKQMKIAENTFMFNLMRHQWMKLPLVHLMYWMTVHKKGHDVECMF